MENQVDEQIKTIRSDSLLELTKTQKHEFEMCFVGEPQDVLIEEKVTIENTDYYRGHSMNYILYDIPCSSLPKLEEGTYINRIVQASL